MHFANKLNFVAKLIISNRWCIVFIWYINPRTKGWKTRWDKDLIRLLTSSRQSDKKLKCEALCMSQCFESLRHEIFYPCWVDRVFHRKSNHPKHIQSQLPKIFYESSLKSSKVLIFKLQCFRKLQKFQLDFIFSSLALWKFINFYFVNISKCVVVLRLQKELEFFC